MFAGVMGGKAAAGSPRSAAVWLKIETRWWRFPVVGSPERGAGVAFLEGLPWWEAMSGGEGGDARPNNEDEMCVRRDRTQKDVVLRNVGGWKEGSGSVPKARGFFFFFSFFLNHMFIVSTVQEMTCIFNDMAKTKQKIKLTINK